jgi:hypothetical protein
MLLRLLAGLILAVAMTGAAMSPKLGASAIADDVSAMR